jgi:hypothetical protein
MEAPATKCRRRFAAMLPSILIRTIMARRPPEFRRPQKPTLESLRPTKPLGSANICAETDGFVVADQGTNSTPHEPRVIAEVKDYAALVAAMRIRAQERQLAIGGEAVAAFTGLPANYLAKILAPRLSNVRRIGMISLGPILAALAVKLLVVEDLQAAALADRRLPKSRSTAMQSGAIQVVFSRRFMKKIGAIGGKNRRKNMTDEEATRHARKAALARWNGSKRTARV